MSELAVNLSQADWGFDCGLGGGEQGFAPCRVIFQPEGDLVSAYWAFHVVRWNDAEIAIVRCHENIAATQVDGAGADVAACRLGPYRYSRRSPIMNRGSNCPRAGLRA